MLVFIRLCLSLSRAREYSFDERRDPSIAQFPLFFSGRRHVVTRRSSIERDLKGHITDTDGLHLSLSLFARTFGIVETFFVPPRPPPFLSLIHI